MIRLRGVTRCFELGGQQVMGLNALDLDIGAGEYVAVMGPSGSGKSTLLNMLGLLDAPDAGEYWLQDEATGSLNEVRRAELRSRWIGFVFQSYHLIPRLSALENIELPMLLAGIEPAERKRRSSALARSASATRATNTSSSVATSPPANIFIELSICWPSPPAPTKPSTTEERMTHSQR